MCHIEDDREFTTLLNFLHDQRILIHFDSSPLLNNMVILDPQWLVDLFTSVITVKPGPYEGKETELWSKLQTDFIRCLRCPTAEINKVHVGRFAPWFQTSDEQVNRLQLLL